MEESDIKYAACYSNGIYGSKWAVFQITREHADATVTFKIVAGAGRRKSGTLPRDEFARWALAGAPARADPRVARCIGAAPRSAGCAR